MSEEQGKYEKTFQRLQLFQGLAHSGCGMSMWCLSNTGEVLYTTSPYEKELKMFLQISGCLKYALEEARDFVRPFIMSDSLGLIWAGEYIFSTGGTERLLIIMGPLFFTEFSVKIIKNELQALDFSLMLQRSCLNILQKVPVLAMTMVHQYVQMMHYAIMEENILPGQFHYQISEAKERRVTAARQNVKLEHETHFNEYVKEYSREQIILQCIKDGNLNYSNIVAPEIRAAIPDSYETGQPLRESKNVVLIFTALCSRAAVEGGLSVKTAKEMEVSYIRQIENTRTVTELMKLKYTMMEDFVEGVHRFKNGPEISLHIRECYDYIKAHFMEPLDLRKIAKKIGYTEYYLTRKFQKEMGISLLDCIRETRLEYAKVWLITTDKSIQEISEQLQFGTRNYFSRIFKEKEGMTPASYRERARIVGKENEVTECG